MANQRATPVVAALNAMRSLEQAVGSPVKGTPPVAGLAAEKLADFWNFFKNGANELNKAGGQKIYDFIDSAFQRPTRTWMGDNPAGGAPAVADVHSLRDVGLVDKRIYDVLRNKFGAPAVRNINVDAPGSPSEARYEEAADFLRTLPDHLNNIGWMGRNDWTASQAQAVGWMATTEFIGDPGNTPTESILYNIRKLNYELAFGKGSPFAEKYGADLAALPLIQQRQVTQTMLDKATDFANTIVGAYELGRVHATGGWLNDTGTPNLRADYIATPEALLDLSAIIGYTAEQTGMLSYRITPRRTSKSKLGIVIHPSKGDSLQDSIRMDELWGALRESDLSYIAAGKKGVFSGYSTETLEDGTSAMFVLLDGASENLLSNIQSGEIFDTINAAGKAMGLDLDGVDTFQDSDYLGNEWTENPDGRVYLQRINERYGPEVEARVRDYKRSQFEPELAQQLQAAGEVETQTGRTGEDLASADVLPFPEREMRGPTEEQLDEAVAEVDRQAETAPPGYVPRFSTTASPRSQ